MPNHRFRIGAIKPTLPSFTFTFEQVMLLKNTLETLKQVMLHQTQPLPNKILAFETMIKLQEKIQHLIQHRILGRVVALDQNEVMMLTISIQIFQAALMTVEPSPEREALQNQCHTMLLHLSAPVEKR